MEKKWLLTPVFLPGKSHGQRNLVGYSPKAYKEPDMTEWLSAHKIWASDTTEWLSAHKVWA